MLERFLSGEIAVQLNKSNKTEIMEFYEIVKPYIDDIHYARQGQFETQLDYLLSYDTGPYHMILTNGYRGYRRFWNGGKIGFVYDRGCKSVLVADFIESTKKDTSFNIEESDIDTLFA